MFTTALSAVIGISNNTKFHNRKDEYNHAQKKYNTMSGKNIAPVHVNQPDEIDNSIRKYRMKRLKVMRFWELS